MPDARSESPAVETALAALADRYGLAPEATAQFGELSRLLVEDPLAPTSVRDPLKVIEDHLADSLVALELDVVRAARHVADLGSGAGLPGLPLAIALPAASVVLLESAARKCAFLERAASQCAVTNARIVHARAEMFIEGLAAFDIVTARAVAPFEVVVEYAAPLLDLGGTLVVWRGHRDRAGEEAAGRAAAEVGLEPGPIVPVKPYAATQSRHLHLMSKVTETPRGFPRRPGMALKRPLGRR